MWAPLFNYPPEISFNTTVLPLPHITPLSLSHRGLPLGLQSWVHTCAILLPLWGTSLSTFFFQVSLLPFFSEKEEFCLSRSPFKQQKTTASTLPSLKRQKKRLCFCTLLEKLKIVPPVDVLSRYWANSGPHRNLVWKFTLPQVLSL